MSRLIDKLTNLRKNETPRMGFGFVTGKPVEEKPRLQIILNLKAADLDKVSGYLSSADAAMVEITGTADIRSLESLCRASDSLPAGGWLRTFEADISQKVINTSCDFTVFPPETPLNMIPKEKIGRILQLDSSLGEMLLRTVNDLPVDAVLIAGDPEEKLTLGRLMFIQRLAYLVNKPILVHIPADITGDELQVLWDTGINGIVILATGDSDGDKLSTLRRTVEQLVPPSARRKPKITPVLPYLRTETPSPSKEDDGEEED